MSSAPDCIFCKIIGGEVEAWPIWEDQDYIAFLTPFPNTPGFTVVAPKRHLTSDVLALPAAEYFGLMNAAKHVAGVLTKALNVKRTGLIVEGMGVDHAHAKLIPMHGIPDGPWKPMLSSRPEFSTEYLGFITTHDGPRMADEELERIQLLVRNASAL